MEKRGPGGGFWSVVLLVGVLGACGKADRNAGTSAAAASGTAGAGGAGAGGGGAGGSLVTAGDAGAGGAGRSGSAAGGSGGGAAVGGSAGLAGAIGSGGTAVSGAGSSNAGQAGEGGEPSALVPVNLDPTWAHWPMPSPAGSGLPHPASYDTSHAGVVIDNVTGLFWQREVVQTQVTWALAQKYCEALSLGGFDDWRLPSRIELVSLIDLSRVGPAIDTNAFPGTPSGEFYSASSDNPLAPNNVLFVNFAQGYSEWTGQNYDMNARCVRSEPYLSANGMAPDRYRVGPSTVVDIATQLMWERLLPSEPKDWMTFEETAARCQALTLGGHADWRAPNLKELLSLVDEHQRTPAVDHQAFVVTPQVWRYWSGSYLPGKPVANPYWAVRLTDGGATELQPDGMQETICVRDADLAAEPTPP